VLCTHGREGLFAQTLDSLANQTLALAEYEVMVVDNHASQNAEVRRVFEGFRAGAFSSHPDHLVYVHCPAVGLASARNAGLSVSRGEIVCFIDDDATALPGWLETMKGAFCNHPDAGVVGGHILLSIPKPRPRVLIRGLESYWGYFVTDHENYAEVAGWAEFPWGSNWGARRGPLLEIGGFRVDYGRSGHDSWGGEELVAATQIQRLGYKIGLEPAAQVLHIVDRERYSLGHVYRAILADLMVRYQATKDGYLEGNGVSLVMPAHGAKQMRDQFVSLIDCSTPMESKLVRLMQVFARLVLVLHIAWDWISTHGYRGGRTENPGVRAGKAVHDQ
jgi:glycosyltransferase involved in cell wall biosynthesis